MILKAADERPRKPEVSSVSDTARPASRSSRGEITHDQRAHQAQQVIGGSVADNLCEAEAPDRFPNAWREGAGGGESAGEDISQNARPAARKRKGRALRGAAKACREKNRRYTAFTRSFRSGTQRLFSLITSAVRASGEAPWHPEPHRPALQACRGWSGPSRPSPARHAAWQPLRPGCPSARRSRSSRDLEHAQPASIVVGTFGMRGRTRRRRNGEGADTAADTLALHRDDSGRTCNRPCRKRGRSAPDRALIGIGVGLILSISFRSTQVMCETEPEPAWAWLMVFSFFWAKSMNSLRSFTGRSLRVTITIGVPAASPIGVKSFCGS